MHLRVLLGGLIATVILASGCVFSVDRPEAPTPSPTSVPLPTPVPLAAWLAQGVPSDTLIEFTYVQPMILSREFIQITADGSAVYDHHSHPSQPQPFRRLQGKLAPETLRRVILAFEEQRFFYLSNGPGQYGSYCLYDSASPAYFGLGKELLDGPSTEVKIRINGISKVVHYSGCDYDLAGNALTEAMQGETNLRELLDLLRDAVQTLPPVTPAPAEM